MTATVGLIGLGHWGKNLARNLHELGALGMMCDASADTLAALRAQYPDVRSAGTPDTILDDASINAVMIATPAVTHGELVARALDAGKHVFVEKPLCLDVEEAAALGRRADEQGQVLMVGHLLLYHPAFQALAGIAHSGSLGRLRYLYSTRASLGKIRREENALWSFAPHDISMILALVGRLPRRIVANGGSYVSADVADTTLSHMDFGDGLQAHVFVSWLHPYKDQRLVVVGEDGMAVFNDVLPGAEKLQLYRHIAEWDGDVPIVTKAEAEPIPYGEGEPLKVECQAFLDAVASGASPPSNAAEGVRVLRVLDACQKALVSGQPALISDGES